MSKEINKASEAVLEQEKKIIADNKEYALSMVVKIEREKLLDKVIRTIEREPEFSLMETQNDWDMVEVDKNGDWIGRQETLEAVEELKNE